MKRALAGIALVMLAGCHRLHGEHLDGRGAWNSPRGANVEVLLREQRPVLQGELVEVSDSGVVVLGAELTWAAWRPVGHVEVLDEHTSFRKYVPGDPPMGMGSAGRKRLALLSRYPLGMPVEARDALLRQLRQDTVRVIR